MKAHFEDSFGYPNQSDGDSQLRLALTILRKRKWKIALSVLTVCTLTALVVWSIPPIYRSSATLELEGQSNLIEIDDIVASAIAADDYLQTQVELMRTPQLAAKVVMELSLNNHWEFDSSAPIPEQFRPKNEIAKFTERSRNVIAESIIAVINKSRKHIPGLRSDVTVYESPTLSGIDPSEIEFIDTVDKVLERARITGIKGTNRLIRVSFESRDPMLAALVANSYGELFVKDNAELKFSKSSQANKQLTGKLEGLKISLNKSEKAVLDFMQANGIVDVRGGAQTLNEQEIRSVTENMIDARREVQAARAPYNQVRDASARSIEAVALVPSVSADNGVHIARRDVQEAQRFLNELSNRYLPKHPKVVDAASNLKIAENNLELQVNIVADQIERNYRNAQSNLSALESQLTSSKVVIQSMAEKKLQLDQLQQQAKTDRELYEIFFGRVRETNETLGLTPAIANFANTATPPLNPIKPRKTQILVTTLLLTLFVSALAALSMEEYKDTIQGIHDVERKLHIGVLGVVPKVKGKRFWTNTEKSLVPGTISDPDGRFIESMRTLRTSLMLSSKKNQSTAVLITSSVPEEGKSTVASHLAQSMAKTETTLLIEADMRRPGISHSINSKQPGLANLLTHDSFRPSACIQRGLFGNVDVITAGHLTEDAPELLADEKFAKLIEILKRRYQWIIIDSAPVQAVSDSLLIGQIADATLFVVRSDSTVSSIARRAIQRLQHYRINILGAVITQVDLDRIHRYGGEHYYQGYIDNYGYGNTTVQPKNRKKQMVDQASFDHHVEYTV